MDEVSVDQTPTANPAASNTPNTTTPTANPA